ncbi:MAG TPA: hypothetical protein VHW67_02580 [Solirubrobacteraceae bacterium]|nr:hypothetical protein [Solirubrobacteraceae bacterium]
MSQTLLAPTTVTTNSTPVGKDGNPAHTCAGGSATGALELATSGNWGGEWFESFGYSAETILGEAHVFEPGAAANYFWSYWLDGKASSVGICEGELETGQSILFFPECFSEVAACPPPPNPLDIDAPSVAEAGSPFTVTVTSHDNVSGVASPAVGATVSDGGVQATTDASGHATLALSDAGNQALRVTAPNSVRSEANVCVHRGNDGNCGTVSPTGVTVPGTVPVAPVYKGPYAVVAHATSVREGHLYTRKSAPRELTGTIATHARIASVSLKLRRSYKGRCFAYNGTAERFQRARCGSGSFFGVGSTPSFSYLLPGALQPGRYVLDVQATDAAGNRTSLARGSSRIVFFVR